MSIVPLLLIFTGVFSLFTHRRILLSPKRLFSSLKCDGKQKRREEGRALLLALSGTLGVGNITGVATALILGGSGSVLWMLLSSLISIPLKYAEGALCADCREGGMAGVLRHTFRGKIGKALSSIYATVFLLLALVLGGAVQGNAIVENATAYLPVRRELLCVLLVFLLALAVFGGVERILRTLSVTLPLATVIYVIMCLCVLVRFRAALPTVILDIFHSAFDGVRPTLGGLFGMLCGVAVKEGFLAGLLSNEAGAGTSTLAHTENTNRRSSGAIGVLEVIFDTTFLCTLSALTFLVSDAHIAKSSAGEVLYSAFFPVLGRGYILPLLISIVFLATSSALCYLVYSRRMLSFLSLERLTFPFALLFLLSIGLGGLFGATALVVLSHITLSLLCVISCLAILFSRGKQDKQKTVLSQASRRKHRKIIIKLFKNGKNS